MAGRNTMLKNGDKLVKGAQYKTPKSDNTFVFSGRYGNNIKCFTRTHDMFRFCGREFIEYKNGVAYLDLEAI